MGQVAAAGPDEAVHHGHAADFQQFDQHAAEGARAALEDDVGDFEVDEDVGETGQQPASFLGEGDAAVDDFEGELREGAGRTFEVARG